MDKSKIKDPYAALFVLEWLEKNRDIFFKDLRLDDDKIINIVNQYIESNRDKLKGEQGEIPKHQWSGTKLRFENPDGTWGKWVDLKGPRGGSWFGGGFNLDHLPISTNPSGVTEIIVKEAGVWKRLPVEIQVAPDLSCTFITSDGEIFITSEGEEFNVICNGTQE